MLLSLPKSGIVVLLKQNSVLVTYTTSMGAHLEGLYNQFRGQLGVSLGVRSAGLDIETLKLHAEYYRQYYIDRGYVGMGSPRKVIRYKVRMLPSRDFKFIDVELVTTRGDKVGVVGRFKNRGEAGAFIETYYGTDNPFKLPVYACNSDTKELALEQQKKILDVR